MRLWAGPIRYRYPDLRNELDTGTWFRYGDILKLITFAYLCQFYWSESGCGKKLVLVIDSWTSDIVNRTSSVQIAQWHSFAMSRILWNVMAVLFAVWISYLGTSYGDSNQNNLEQSLRINASQVVLDRRMLEHTCKFHSICMLRIFVLGWLFIWWYHFPPTFIF